MFVRGKKGAKRANKEKEENEEDEKEIDVGSGACNQCVQISSANARKYMGLSFVKLAPTSCIAARMKKVTERVRARARARVIITVKYRSVHDIVGRRRACDRAS